ncbi:hypothetical protein ACFU7X_28065 [Streptomyces chartreusis]|uniref:hypothetical protein n=1 Tax=Streptomyces chartreusis TaxID=1969 RepID=UPI0036CE8C85
MSYPQRVYDGDGGEINADFRPADTPPNVGTAGADAIHFAFRNDSDAPAEMERARFFDEHDSYFVE